MAQENSSSKKDSEESDDDSFFGTFKKIPYQVSDVEAASAPWGDYIISMT